MIFPELPTNTYIYKCYSDPPARGLPPRRRERSKPEHVPDWVQAEKIRKAQEKRERKRKVREQA